MHRPLDTYDHIAIAEVAIYSLFLIGGVILCIKHGMSRSAGWRFLVILALARLVGSSLRLATISDPTNTNLSIGWMVCNSIALGPLILMLLGLLSRVFDSINRQGQVVVKPIYQRLIQVLMLVSMILLIVGGTKSTYTIQDNKPKVEYAIESRVGMGLIIAVLVFVIFETLLAFRNQGYVSQGEHRIILAVIVALPFVAVRLIYSSLVIFAGHAVSAWLYLGASVLMEMITVLIVEVVGFSLGKAPPMPVEQESQMQSKV